MTKRLRNVIGLWCLLALPAGGLTGCAAGGSPVDESAGEEPVTVSFTLYQAPATRAEEVRMDTLLNDGATIRVYAFAAGATDLASPLASSLYTVSNSNGIATATGDLALYRGTYDLYLVSYNSKTEAPSLGGGGKIDVSNGKDFMYTTLKGVVIQPEHAGANTIELTLTEPFTRMGAQVLVKVKARNGTQPVTPSTLQANNIKITGLPASLSYGLGHTAWDALANPGDDYQSSYVFRTFHPTTELQQVTDWWVSDPVVLLPVDGSKMLDFEVNLIITYGKEGLTYTDPFKASIQKVLLPGMTYEFEFSLTFYGILTPTDLTLAVKEYDTIKLDNKDDGLGAD